MRSAIGVAGLSVALAAAALQVRAGAESDSGSAGTGTAADRAAGAAAFGTQGEYVVLYKDAAAGEAARAAVRAAGGSILRENTAIGTAVVRASGAGFATAVRRSGAVLGAAPNRPIGFAPTRRPARELVERLAPDERAAVARAGWHEATAKVARGTALTASAPVAAPLPVPADTADAPAFVQEPLADRQWDMAAIGATATGSYATEPGDRRVRVGIMDTGIDGSHPDIAPNFDRDLSRNFVTDLPDTDGPCEVTSCIDPVDVDDDGHGTHVASTIGAPINGIGIAGVAPNVTLVNVRAGQDSGFFFLQSVVDALTYSGDAGLDVVNMSFYVDPWMFNCAANAADPPEAQEAQRTTVAAVQRAVSYATQHGVTLVASMGNDATDLGRPTLDTSSPNFPEGHERDRTVDNSCLTVPAEADGVLAISSIGPSGRKASYSNYGLEQTDLAAPGGDAFDTTDGKSDPAAMVLAAYPAHLAKESGDIDANGKPTTPFVVQDCAGEVCGYYQYLQGTSMAAPHATGVAALAVSRFGSLGPSGDLGLDPKLTELALVLSADRRACPTPPTYTYVLNRAGGTETFQHTCEEGLGRNGFYGQGIVNAGTLAQLPTLKLGGPSPQAPPAQPPAAPPTPTAGDSPPSAPATPPAEESFPHAPATPSP